MIALTFSSQIGKMVFLMMIGTIICIWLWHQLNHPKCTWYSQHIIPENPRTDRNISEDVLIYDYDNDCNLIAYYSYSDGLWCFIGTDFFRDGKQRIEPTMKFKWRYFDIDIDEP